MSSEHGICLEIAENHYEVILNEHQMGEAINEFILNHSIAPFIPNGFYRPRYIYNRQGPQGVVMQYSGSPIGDDRRNHA